MFLNKIKYFNDKSRNNLNFLTKLSVFQFSRQTKTLNKFVPIYPKDKVVVLPPFMSLKNLSSFDRRIMRNKYKDLLKIQYGKVISIYRKRNLAIVSNVNKKEKFTDPKEFMHLIEQGDIHKVKRRVKFLPVNLSRLRLRDTTSSEIKPLYVKTRISKEGVKERYDVSTGNVIEKPNLEITYESRTKNKKTGSKDTLALQVAERTYTGVDYISVAREFLNRIKEKKTIESNLNFKDK